MLNCPPDYAYGAKGIPGVIPPDSTLIFDVDLVAIKGKSVFAEEVVPHIQGEVVEQDKDDGTLTIMPHEPSKPLAYPTFQVTTNTKSQKHHTKS